MGIGTKLGVAETSISTSKFKVQFYNIFLLIDIRLVPNGLKPKKELKVFRREWGVVV